MKARMLIAIAMVMAAMGSGVSCGHNSTALNFSAPEPDEKLAVYVEQLEDPTKLSKKDAISTEVSGLLAAYAPRIVWHPNEPYGATDPLEFVRGSSLWSKRSLGRKRFVGPRGGVEPIQLARMPADQGEFFLRYEGEARRLRLSKTAPVLWRLGDVRRVGGERARASENGRFRVLIEYWYHSDFNRATTFAVGNHQGDWEGMAVLVEFGLDAQGKLEHKPVLFFLAQHKNGSWHCPSELRLAEGHPEIFSALGTHASYVGVGSYQTAFIVDVTARGSELDGWKNLRPLVLEPYYGFRGSWGDTSLLPSGSGPQVPNSTKLLPGRPLPNDSKAQRWLGNRC